MRRREWLEAGPFTLALSGGFFGFFAHTGLLGALEAAGLRPARVVGTSAGALAGGAWAAGVPVADLEGLLRRVRRPDFWDPGLPLGGLLRGRRFAGLLEGALGGVTAIEQCRVPFAAVVHDVLRRRPVALERGPLEAAIRASCCVPLLFRPVVIDRRLYVDGGVSDRPGFTALRPDERVLYHHLQPHERPRSETPAPPGGGLVLRIDGLPLVTPFHLERGPDALAHARESAARWLDAPMA